MTTTLKDLYEANAPALATRILARLPHAWRVVLRNAHTLAFKHGQLETARCNKATDAGGEPIPWYTYPAIEYLSSFDLANRSVFEYGSGHSSIWWARRASTIISIEHDAGWYEQVKTLIPHNVRLLLETDADAYSSAIEKVGMSFDVIVIDGRFRTRCARVAPRYLAQHGLLILDNCDWYPKTASVLREQGFFQVDFNGFGPINDYAWTTSIFVHAPTKLQGGFRAALPLGGIRDDGDSTD